MPFLTFLLLVALWAVPMAFGESISGRLVDVQGVAVSGAQVKLLERIAVSEDNGAFSLSEVATGPFRLEFTAKGFAAKTIIGELSAGQSLTLPDTVLIVDKFTTSVNVTQTQVEIAQEQIREAEKQRIGGLVPNFFANYNPDAAPLTTKQKFELTWKTLLDPSTFVITGIAAGVDQARNTRKGFGQGAQGYAKRYGASYLDFATTLAIEKVIMTTVFKQDPRYFAKSTGSKWSRVGWAVSRSVICQGDNRKAQFCYSTIGSRFASGFLTNRYYPADSRNSSSVIVQNSLIGIGAEAAGNLFQEFLARKLMRKK